LDSYPEFAEKTYEEFKNSYLKQTFKEIVFCGMGGSSSPALILKPFFEKRKIKVKICQNYKIPNISLKNSLIVVISYSGNTLETIKCLNEALKRKLKTVVISSNGKIIEIAKKFKVKYFEIEKNLLPRLAIPIFLVLILSILRKSLRISKKRVKEIIKILRITRNRRKFARRVARRIKGTIPLIYSFPEFYGVAYRFKTQINENAKIHAFVAKLPEAAHNEIAAFEDRNSQLFSIIFLGTPSNNFERKIMNSFEFTVMNKVVNVVRIEEHGKNLLEKLVYLTYFCDYVSYFLAILKGINPSSTPLIDSYKKKLKK